jgi:hypothetical protein
MLPDGKRIADEAVYLDKKKVVIGAKRSIQIVRQFDQKSPSHKFGFITVCRLRNWRISFVFQK